MKFGFVDEHRAMWPVRVMCDALGLSASGYYAWRTQPESARSAANRALIEDIRLIQTYILGRARKHDVPVIENGSIESAIGEVMELVLAAAPVSVQS